MLLLAAVAVGLSLSSHVAAGGAYPGTVPLVVLTALTAVAVRPLTRGELAMPVLLGSLGAGQVLLHVVFEQCVILSVAPGQTHHADAGPAPWMIAAHAVATLAVAGVLRHGEALVWRLWAWLTGRRLPGRPRIVVVGAPSPHGILREPRSLLAGRLVRERGPPVAA